MKHIPTPITINKLMPWNLFDGSDADLALVQQVSAPDTRLGSPIRSARTEEIKIAVNAHDELVATVRDFLRWSSMPTNATRNRAVKRGIRILEQIGGAP